MEIRPAKAPDLVPVEALRSGDPIIDDCVVLELESKANDQLRVIEASFPSYYVMGLSPRHPIV